MLAPVYDASRRQVVFTSMDAKVHAVRVDDGVPLFSYETGGGIYASACIEADTVFVASLDKVIYAIDLKNGTLRWKFLTTGRIFASPALADGSLWIGSNDGVLYELDPDSGKRRSLFQASERIVTRVAYDEATRRIYVGTVANEIYCLQRE